MGSVQIPMFNIFAFEEHIPRIFEGYDEKKDIRLHIDDEYVRKMNELHVEKFSELLTRDKLSSIEDLLINCINIS